MQDQPANPNPIPTETDAPRPFHLPRIPLPGISLVPSERRLLLLAIDILMLFGALLLSIWLRTDWADNTGMAELAFYNWKWFATLAILWLVACAMIGSYDLARAASAPHSILSTVTAALVAIFVYHFTPCLSPPLESRGLVFYFVGLSVAGLTLWRGVYALLLTQPTFRRTALVLGAGTAGRALSRELDAIPAYGNPFQGSGYQIVGFVDDDPEKLGQDIGEAQVLGSSAELAALASRLLADEIVLAITHRHTMSVETFDALLACRERGFGITTMPSLYERLLGRVPVEHIGRDVSAVLPTESRPALRLFHVLKRGIDLLAGLIGGIGFCAVIPFVALANAFWSPGPLLFKQKRVGKGGQCSSSQYETKV
jgi:hypothetical protein